MSLGRALDVLIGEGISIAVCTLPMVQGEARKMFVFTRDEQGVLKNQDGVEFIIEPFAPFYPKESQRETSRDEHHTMVSGAVKKMQAGELDKVIVSRIKHAERNGDQAVQEVFEKLATLYPKAFVYLLNTPEYGTWIGATPELLLEKTANEFRTVSLAGTQPVKESGEIAWNEKLLNEQQIVSDFIRDELEKAGVKSLRVDGPATIEAGPIAHLKTTFEFRSDKTSKDLANILHPTPAICGMPREKARTVISELEEHERRLYTGYLGMNYPGGDALYFVNLRCMQVFGDHFELYLGGGITASSDPHEEWEETEHKAKVLLKGIEG